MLPPEPRIAAVVQAYARILDRFGEKIGKRPLVLPTAEFFPDAFVGDEASVQTLCDRMKAHAGLGDLAFTTRLAEGGGHGGHGGGSCGSCGCGEGEKAPAERLTRDDAGWHLAILASELRAPEVLATQIARGVAVAFLAEASGEASPTAVDVAAVALGFGALLIEGSYVYKKSCGGPSVARFTALGPEELAIAVALFAALGGHSVRRVAREVGTTQRDALGEAWAFVDSNRDLVSRLGSAPGRVAAGDFEICEPRAWLSRLLFKPKPGRRAGADAASGDDDLEALQAALEAAPAPAKAKRVDPKLDEIKRLVDEAFGEP